MDLAKHQITYLVDLENVGTKLLYQHVEHNKNAEYVVFCSESTSSPSVILENVPADLKISFVDCETHVANAMDFCISAEAGRLSTNSDRLIRILSDDKGYDPMLHMLHRKGVRIVRETTYEPVKKDMTPINEEQKENTALIKAIRTNVPQKYQKDVLAVLPDALSRKEAHEMLQAILPDKMVSGIYKKLKKQIPQEKG